MDLRREILIPIGPTAKGINRSVDDRYAGKDAAITHVICADERCFPDPCEGLKLGIHGEDVTAVALGFLDLNTGQNFASRIKGHKVHGALGDQMCCAG